MHALPFINFIQSDKSAFPKATTKGFVDADDDFLIGDSGGFLMNWSFIFKHTDKFSEVAQFFQVHGRYTLATKGSIEYTRFWTRETERRKKGLTLNCKLPNESADLYFKLSKINQKEADKLLQPLRITGDHYNYLNYGRILRTPTASERKQLEDSGNRKQTMIDGFPRFWDGDYWNFKVDEFIANNGFNLCKSKARGKGYSFKRGSQGANTMNLYPKAVVLLAAFKEDDYLTGAGMTADMLKTNLNWFETHTYWKRGFISEDISNLELGYKEQSTGHMKKGWLSKGQTISVYNNASGARGKRAWEIDVEEAGDCPNLQEFLNATMSSTEVGFGRVGTIRCYGTAGSKSVNWQPFANAFYNPHSNAMMPFENVWDFNARHTLCGFFHPQVLNAEPFIDADGNSDFIAAYEYDIVLKEKAYKDKSETDYLQFVAERANMPSEAFGTNTENLFSSAALNLHIKNVASNPELKFWRDGMITRNKEGLAIFRTNQEMTLNGEPTHHFIENVPIKNGEDPIGCIREFHQPKFIDGKVPAETYYVVFDSVGKDKDVKNFNVRNSLNCIQVYTYPNAINGIPSDTLVMSYAGRFNSLEDTSRLVLDICDYYNAKCLPEVDRGQIVSDFRRWAKLFRLYRNPSSIIEEKATESLNADYGIIIGTGERKEDGLMYLKDYLYTPISVDSETGNTLYNFHRIYDLPYLYELQRFNLQGNFDRVSTGIVGAFQRKAYRVKRGDTTQRTSNISIEAEIGLYGYK